MDTRRRHQWLVFPEGFSLQVYTPDTGGIEDARYLSMYMLRKARRNLFFSSAQASRPSTYQGAQSSFVPPTTTAAVAFTTSTQLWPIDRRPLLLFERSEFLIATCKKKKTDRLSVRIISWF